MLAEHRDRFARSAALAPAARRRVGQLGDRGVHAGLEHLGGRAELRIFAVMREIGPIAADRRRDRLAGLRMRADLARQRQQPLGDFGIHILERNVLRDRSALVAALDIGSEAAALEQDAVAELGRAVALRLFAALAELLRVFAVGIVGAGDERAELAAAQAQPAVAALRADARVAAVGTRRIEPGRQELVERLR